MKIHVVSGLLIAAGLVALGNSVSLTGTTDTISFNPNFDPPTLLLGSNHCIDALCILGGRETMGGATIDWSFTEPESVSGHPSVFTYSYLDGSGTISTAGTPTLAFRISDSKGDSATGTFALDTLTSTNGGDTVDIAGVITLTSLNDGRALAAFQNLLGIPLLPSDLEVPFNLVVGDCNRGETSVACVSNPSRRNSIPPTAEFLSLTLDTPGNDAPEPGTFVLFGVGLGSVALLGRRAHRRALADKPRP
jgi:hypothetical protein